ncbi:MAG: alkaline phosphatase family protein [Actinomycetota bacterium]
MKRTYLPGKRVKATVLALCAVVLVVAVVAWWGDSASPPPPVPEDAPTLDEMAEDVGKPVMRLLKNGHVAGRSGELLLVSKPHNFINRLQAADFASLGSGTPVLASSHPNPWAYLTRVPIIMYGPGHVPAGVESDTPVDITSLAATYAGALEVDGFRSAAPPLQGFTERRRPKVILTIVIDGGGWNTLRLHPSSHPNIDALRAAGLTYVNATIGSAPSVTGAVHATFGTGTYPTSHGLPGNVMRYPDGEIGDVFLDGADPRYIQGRTVSELWDEQNGNRAVVGTVSYEGWHLGMIGQGAQRAGGDRDIAALWDIGEEEGTDEGWWIAEDYYRLPAHLSTTHFSRLERYEASLDSRDGLRDGMWFGHTIGNPALDERDGERDGKYFDRPLNEVAEPATRPGTPAFARFTGDAVVDVLRRESLGEDDITDLLWVEMKMPDYAGHLWNVISPEEGDVLSEVDRQIGRFKAELDQIVGRGNYVIAISADHGQQPLPETTGGWRIDLNEVERDIELRFGRVVEQATPADFFIDTEALDEAGYSLEDIARYLGTYTIEDSIPRTVSLDNVPHTRLNDRVFAGVFPTGYLTDLTPEEIDALGPGDYPEGDLTIEPAD